MKNLKCPYCNKKVSYYMGLLERKQGEHTCNKCGKNSTIYYNKSMKITALLTVLISIGMFVIWYLYYNHNYILGAAALIVPFLIFLIISPFFIHLVPLKIHNKNYSDNYNKSDLNENVNIKKNIYKDSMIDFGDDNQNLNVNKSYTKVMPIITDESKIEKIDDEEFVDISSIKV